MASMNCADTSTVSTHLSAKSGSVWTSHRTGVSSPTAKLAVTANAMAQIITPQPIYAARISILANAVVAAVARIVRSAAARVGEIIRPWMC